MRLDAVRLSAFSRIFSSAVIKEMAVEGRSPLFARLVREAFSKGEQLTLSSVADAFDFAFRLLRTGANRDEYIYKAAITQRILLGRHTLRSACMLNEFRIGACKADLVVLNGSATVYEIKSDRDSLTRLQNQLRAYQTVFPKCYVIAGENHISSVVNSIPDGVGVLQLTPRYQIGTIREAQERMDLVQAVSVFDAIRINEAVEVLRRLSVEIPEVPNTRLRSELRSRFAQLEPQVVYSQLLEVMKQSRSLSTLEGLISNLPQCLHAAALTVRIKRTEQERLVTAVNSKFEEALGWA